jgi:hypothetical protein
MPMATPPMLILSAISNSPSEIGIFSLSKSAVSRALDVSEYALLLFGVILALGIIGEYAKSEKWKSRKRTFEILVIIGVAGEIFADGGIFLFSLQTISDREIAVLNGKAGEANRKAGEANQKAGEANCRASANQKEAARLGKLAEDERLARVKIEQSLAWRRLDPQELKQLARPLLRFTGQSFTVITDESDPERSDAGFWIEALLTEAHWKSVYAGSTPELSARSNVLLSTPWAGVAVWPTPKANKKVVEAAKVLASLLAKKGFGAFETQVIWGLVPLHPPPSIPGEDALLRVVVFKKQPYHP